MHLISLMPLGTLSPEKNDCYYHLHREGSQGRRRTWVENDKRDKPVTERSLSRYRLLADKRDLRSNSHLGNAIESNHNRRNMFLIPLEILYQVRRWLFYCRTNPAGFQFQNDAFVGHKNLPRVHYSDSSYEVWIKAFIVSWQYVCNPQHRVSVTSNPFRFR
jgi:hypothetical protein